MINTDLRLEIFVIINEALTNLAKNSNTRIKVGLQKTGMIQDPGFDLYFHPIISLYVKVDICDFKTLTNSVQVTQL